MLKNKTAPGRQGGRLETLDLLRGLTLISMIIYHGMWDFLYLSETGASMTALRDWYETGGHLWQQSICRTFILLSGFCVPFSRRIFRRGLQVSAGGIAVSAVTIIALYEDRVVFGVLTFLGAAMLATGALQSLLGKSGAKGAENLAESAREAGKSTGAGRASGSSASVPGKPAGRGKKTAIPWVCLAVCLFLFHVTRWINLGYLRLGPWIRLDLPAGLYTFGSGSFPGYVLTALGFTMKGFFSTDYFSFLPWIFLFWAGLFLNRVLFAAPGSCSGDEAAGKRQPERGTVENGQLEIGQAVNRQASGSLFDSPVFHLELPLLNAIGRHSLPVYLLHQPVLYLLTMILF